MDKDQILKMSQQEGRGKYDERELAAFGKASKLGMLVGGLLCVALVLVSEFWLHYPKLALAGWMIYCAMHGTSELVLYSVLKGRFKLVFGLLNLLFAVAFAVLICL